jgi:dTDP-4-amino-4,6-dideoxygalactose transaminase
VHDEIGVNSRLDTIQAAILDVKLKYLDEYAAKRRAVADFYDNAFKDIKNVQTPVRAPYSTHVFHQYTLLLHETNREDVRNKLSERGIPSMIYYPIPLHLQKAYKDSRYKEGAFPVTEHLCKSVISLPIHTEFEPEQLDYIQENFRKIVQS